MKGRDRKVSTWGIRINEKIKKGKYNRKAKMWKILRKNNTNKAKTEGKLERKVRRLTKNMENVSRGTLINEIEKERGVVKRES